LVHVSDEPVGTPDSTHPQGSILVVDDESLFRTMVAETMTEAHFEVLVATTGEEAMSLLDAHPVDVVLLDILLPGMDGFEVCRRIRAAKMDLAIIMLSTLDPLKDRIRGLALGADDYMLKPFHIEELVARIQAVLRRSRKLPDLPVQQKFRNLDFDFQSGKCFKDGEDVGLTPKEFQLLVELCTHPGQVLSRAHLAARIWGERHEGGEKCLDVYIGRLRRKIDGHSAEPTLIHTVRGSGYFCN
jgi:DNA-binding response OmpR family regulator